MATSGPSIAALAGESLPSAGKRGFGTFAPLLDSAGNSVKGQRVAEFPSQRLGMDLFVSNSEA
jgi:glutaminase